LASYIAYSGYLGEINLTVADLGTGPGRIAAGFASLTSIRFLFGAGEAGAFPNITFPEPMIVPTPWEGGDGNAVNDPERKKAAKLK
jgi:hypothetical protein